MPPAARALNDAGALLALIALLWLLHVYGRTVPTAGLAATWLALTGLLTAALFARARARRAVLLAGYLRTDSPLERRLRGGWLMAASRAPLAGVLAVMLIVAVIRLGDQRVWVVLVAAVPALVVTEALVRRTLASPVRPAQLPDLAWRVTQGAVGAAMIAVLMVIALHRSYPDLAAVSLESAVYHLADRERARSEWAQVLLQAAAAKDALRLWLAQQLMPHPGASLAQGAGWLVVIAEEALFVWTYLLACGAVRPGAYRIVDDDEPAR